MTDETDKKDSAQTDDHQSGDHQSGQNETDFSTWPKLTFDSAKGRLEPVEISEYNNLLSQVNGEINAAATEEETARFKKRLEALQKKLHP